MEMETDMNVEVREDNGNERTIAVTLPELLVNDVEKVAKRWDQSIDKIVEWSLTGQIGVQVAMVLALAVTPAFAEGAPTPGGNSQMHTAAPAPTPVKKPSIFKRSLDGAKAGIFSTAHAIRHPKEAYHAAVKKPLTQASK